MEKISIARRRLEKKKSAVYVNNKPNDSPSYSGSSNPGDNYSPPAGSCSPSAADHPVSAADHPTSAADHPTSAAGYPVSEAGYPASEAGYPASETNLSSPSPSSPPPEMSKSSQQTNTAVLQTPPVYSLDSLISLINEEGGLLELGKKQFTLEIVSGVEKPIKMLVSIHPVNENSNFPGKGNNYEEGYMTPEEAAQILKVSKNTIYRQLKEGSLKGLKIGCRWRVLLSPQGKTEGSERGNG